MMQDDSNGESTFEFVEKKVEGMSLVDNVPKQDRPHVGTPGLNSLVPSEMPSVAPTTSGPYLSAVPPPSALPSFVPPVTTGRPGPPMVTTIPPSTITPTPTAILAPSTVPSSITSNPPPAPSVSTLTTSSSSNVFHPTSFSPFIPASKGSSPTYDIPPSSAEGDGNGTSSLLNWMRGAVGSGGQILSKVAEKAKNSVDSMITTLDPQMRDFLYSGGSVSIVVASEQDVIVHPVRDAFQTVFGKATVFGLPVDITKVAAVQPVGFTAGIKAAGEKLSALRSIQNLPPDQAVLAVENIIVEIGEGKWFDVTVLLLNDPTRNVTLEAFTQMTPIPPAVVAMAKEDTPEKYPLRWSGLSVAISSIMASNLQVPPTEWHQAYMGVSHAELLTTAARMLAGLYKSSIGPVL